VLIWSILVFPVLGHAGGFCLLLAENYYEQLYCEVKAQGGGKRLPLFYDFRKNNEMTQALLLRRPLAKIGVQIVLPRNIQTNAKAVNDPDVLAFTAGGDGEDRQDSDIDVQKNNRFGHYDFNKCFFEATHILCRGERYQLMANQANKKLSRGALAGDNRMAIPVFQGLIGDKEGLGRYLSVAYQQYIQKMLEIGLGGSTFSYAKFVFLFQDVTSKGIDFSQRFETMFGFLKQDKQRLAVNEQPAKNVRVVKEQCDWLAKSLVVCDVGGKNYIYQSRSNNLMPNVSTTLENGVK
jgi:hypothetical protein